MTKPASTFWTVSKEGICSVHMHPGQKAVWNSKRRFVFMIAGSQGGKALDADTLIPTPAGFRKISELSVGDSVFGSDGKSAGVTFHSGLMFNHRCYRVSFDDGTSIIADAEHLWTVQTYKQRKNERRHGVTTRAIRRSKFRIPTSSVVTTEQMAGSIHATNGGSNYSIALSSAIEYPIANLLVPPYTLGAWLGDGTSTKPFITSADEEVVQQIRNEGIWIERDECGSVRTGKASSYRIGKPNRRGGNDHTKSPVFLELDQLSVLSNKHIPDCYLTASKEQRLELLRGLMDTDGYATGHGRVEFDSTNKRLADGVAELVRSLGVKTRISTGRATLYGRDCGEKYTVTFFPNFTVFYVKRKAARQYNPTRPDVNNLYVVGIEEVESRPVCCIAVSAYNSLYVAGREYILTHNTSYGPWWLNREIDRMGSGDYLAITTSYDLFKLKMLPEMKTVFEKLLQRGRYWPGDKLIELRDPETGQFWAKRSQDDMWGRIILRSTQSEGGLESATAKAAWLDEVGQDDFSLQNWEAVLRRLSIYQGRALGTTTLYNLGWLKCVSGDTRLVKSDGTETRIDNIKFGDMVLTLGGNRKIGPSKVIQLWPQGIKPVYRIRTSSGRVIVATEVHPFLTEKGWEQLGKLVVGNRIATPRVIPCGTVSESRARLLGWLLAEGALGDSCKISLGEDEAVTDVSDSLPEGVWLNHYDGCDYSIRSAGQNRFCQNPVTVWLRKLGVMGCNSWEKYIPNECMGWNEKSIAELLGGMFSGDGSVSKSENRVYLCTVSEQMAYGVQSLLLRLGIISSVIKIQKPSCFHVRVSHISSIDKFSKTIRLIPRKQAAIEAIISSPNRNNKIGNADRVWVNGKWSNRFIENVDDDILWDKIVEISKQEPQPVFDVQIDGNHNFIGNNIFAHNTEIYDRWKAGDTDYDVIQFDSVINPAFPKAEFERAEKSLPTWRFNMFYRGQFTKPAGLVYADFLDSYVVNPFKIPNHWQVVVGVDFGGANTCLIWAAQDPVSEIWYIYDEYLAGGKSTREHASSVFAHAEENKESIEDITFVGGSMSERQARIDWAEAGVRVSAPPFDSVEPGIDKVTEVMKSNHLRVFRSCSGWRDEIGTYRREMDTDGNVSDKISQKRKFHRMDATRYMFSHIIGRGGVDVIGLGSYPGLGRM